MNVRSGSRDGEDPAVVRLALLGTGVMGEEHLKALAHVPEIKVVAVADGVPERAREIARRHGIERVEPDIEALAGAADVDAVAVAIPPAALVDVIPIACAHGKSILCEKPLGVDAEHARALLDAATEAGVVHALCHQRRYDPVHRRVRDLVAHGFVGAPMLVAVQVMTDWGTDAPATPARQWTRQRRPGGGLLLQVLTHYLDLLHFTFGELDVSFCDAATAPTPNGEDPPGDGDDTVLLTGTLPDGGRVSLAASWSLHHSTGVAWQIHGTEGTIEITPELRIHGARGADDMHDLGLPADYLPAVAGEHFSPYGKRTAYGWGNNTPMLACLATEFASQVNGTLDTTPCYATFADGLWVLEAIDQGRGA